MWKCKLLVHVRTLTTWSARSAEAATSTASATLLLLLLIRLVLVVSQDILQLLLVLLTLLHTLLHLLPHFGTLLFSQFRTLSLLSALETTRTARATLTSSKTSAHTWTTQYALVLLVQVKHL